MPSIDQRILIPAPPELIWQYVGAMEKHPVWRKDCERVLPLGTATHEPGSRWRYIQRNGADFVIEITTYLARTGFEYSVIDGLTIGNARGRFRLQEVSEGTAIYWSFEFQGGGFLGRGGRQKRAIEAQMEGSLRQLWQVTRELPDRTKTHEPRASVQEAPDADARASYIPRHSSKLPPNDILAAAAATPPNLEDTQQLPTLDAEEVKVDFPPPNTDDTPATPMPISPLYHTPPPSEDDTPAKPFPAVTPIPANPELDPSSHDAEEELSIFDIFGIQRSFDSPNNEDLRPLSEPVEDEQVLPVSSRVSSRDEDTNTDTRPREGARARLRRRLVRDFKK